MLVSSKKLKFSRGSPIFGKFWSSILLDVSKLVPLILISCSLSLLRDTICLIARFNQDVKTKKNIIADGVCKCGGVGRREPSKEFCGFGNLGEFNNSSSSTNITKLVKCNRDEG
jgi:hypothetical protein